MIDKYIAIKISGKLVIFNGTEWNLKIQNDQSW